MFSDYGVVFDQDWKLCLFDGETTRNLDIDVRQYGVKNDTVVIVSPENTWQTNLHRYHLKTGELTFVRLLEGYPDLYFDGNVFFLWIYDSFLCSCDGIDWKPISVHDIHTPLVCLNRWSSRRCFTSLRYADDDINLTVTLDNTSTITTRGGSIEYDRPLDYLGRRNNTFYFYSSYNVISVTDNKITLVKRFNDGISSAAMNDMVLVVAKPPRGYWTTDFVEWTEKSWRIPINVGGYIMDHDEILFHPRWKIGIRLLPAFRRRQRTILLFFRRCGISFVIFHQVMKLI